MPNRSKQNELVWNPGRRYPGSCDLEMVAASGHLYLHSLPLTFTRLELLAGKATNAPRQTTTDRPARV